MGGRFMKQPKIAMLTRMAFRTPEASTRLTLEDGR